MAAQFIIDPLFLDCFLSRALIHDLVVGKAYET